MNESSGENLEEENFLYHFLCRIRKETAAREGVPPYRVFSDAVLHDIAHIRPRSQEAMMGIRGIGPARWERYGSFFLKALAEAVTSSLIPLRSGDGAIFPAARERSTQWNFLQGSARAG